MISYLSRLIAIYNPLHHPPRGALSTSFPAPTGNLLSEDDVDEDREVVGGGLDVAGREGGGNTAGSDGGAGSVVQEPEVVDADVRGFRRIRILQRREERPVAGELTDHGAAGLVVEVAGQDNRFAAVTIALLQGLGQDAGLLQPGGFADVVEVAGGKDIARRLDHDANPGLASFAFRQGDVEAVQDTGTADNATAIGAPGVCHRTAEAALPARLFFPGDSYGIQFIGQMLRLMDVVPTVATVQFIEPHRLGAQLRDHPRNHRCAVFQLLAECADIVAHQPDRPLLCRDRLKSAEQSCKQDDQKEILFHYQESVAINKNNHFLQDSYIFS